MLKTALNFLMVAILLALGACTNVVPVTLLTSQWGGQGELVASPPPVSFHPSDKPANPASLSLQTQIFHDLKSAQRLIPEDAAYFASIIVGDRVHEIYAGGIERETAINKLSSEGRHFLAEIRSHCTIVPAQKNESGRPKPGSTVTTSIRMNSSGAACDFMIDKNVVKQVTASNTEMDSAHGVYRWSETLSTDFSERRTVASPTIARASNIKELQFKNRITGKVDYAASNAGFKINALLKGSGYATLTFADGGSLKGPVHSETITNDGQTTTKVRFYGSTGQGDILILALRDPSGAVQVYVNGTPASTDVLDAFGLNLMETASRRL